MGDADERMVHARKMYHLWGKKAPEVVISELEELAKDGFRSGGGACVRVSPGCAAYEIMLRARKTGPDEFRLSVAGQMPDSDYTVQRQFMKGTLQEVIDYLRKPGIEDELARMGEEMDDSVAERMGEYPFG